MNKIGALVLIVIALASPGVVCPAWAAPPAAYCGPDLCLRGPASLLPLKVQSRGTGGTPGNFDYYVLSLTWSSAFCETPAGERARGQCDAGANLGFVVHGLWPQYEQGYPSDCGPAARFPSRVALESAQGLYPSEGLARHEWLKHGTCSGKSPTDYFADVRHARESIVIPRPLPAPRKNRPGHRLILRARSSPPIRGCGQACWALPAQTASCKR